jgi:hypothetical protein
MNTYEPPGPKVHVPGAEVSHIVSGDATVATCGCDQTRAQDSIAPRCGNLPLFPVLHMGWLNRFRVLSPKPCSTKMVLYENNSTSRIYPIRVLSRTRPTQTVVMPENNHAAAWEAPVVKLQCPLWELSCHTNPELETAVAQRDHKEVSQSRVPTHLVHDAPPPETQP